MNKIITTLGVAAFSLFALQSSAIDIKPSNLNSNIYFDSYDDVTKTIKGVKFSVLTDGTNSNNHTGPCTIKLYFLVQGTEDPIFIKTFNVQDGLKELTATEWGPLDVDLSQLTNIPTGTYRLGIYVDADEQVAEDNENNNAILFDGSIDYTKGTVVAKKPDLVIGDVVYSYANKMLTVSSIKITNQGTADAAGSEVEVNVEGGGGSGGGSTTIDGIKAGETVDVDFGDIDLSIVPDGITMSLTVSADSKKTIDELDENNNSKLVTNDISQVPTGLFSQYLSSNQGLRISSQAVELEMPAAATLSIDILDNQGNVVNRLYQGALSQGAHRFEHQLNAKQLYICRVSTPEGMVSKKFVLQ